MGPWDSPFISADNLSATKSRILLLAAMLRLGALPPAADPAKPTRAELSATADAVLKYQHIFDTH